MAAISSSSPGLRVAVITVSDSRHAGNKEDVSGQTLVDLIQKSWNVSALPVQIDLPGVHLPIRAAPGVASMASSYIWKMTTSDDIDAIQTAIKFLCDSDSSRADVVITTGGTGFAERDVTPEATRSLLTKEAPGLVIALMMRSLQATPFAALSRLSAGIRGRTLIVNMPGSVKAVKECWEILDPLVPHAVNLLRGESEKAELLHQQLAETGIENLAQSLQLTQDKPRSGHKCPHVCGEDNSKSSISADNAASRPRVSPYPMIPFEEAVDHVMRESVAFPRRITEVDLLDGLDHILAEDIRAPEPQPPFPASIKDGYAVIASDLDGEREVLPMAATAGVKELPALQSGWCMRISTGAPVPQGADAVVQVEDTKLLEEKDGEEIKVFINKAPDVGQDIRPIGCDVAANETVLVKGTRLTSAEIGILASVGRNQVAVYEWPKIAIMSTGDELIDTLSPGQQSGSLPYGKIRDSNRPELMALLRQHGIDARSVIDGGICLDEPSAILAKLRGLFDRVDVIVTSGGVSMGERDLLKQVLVNDLGFMLHFARVEMKPGKPTAFASGIWSKGGKNETVLFFGLPGNPVSAWVTAQLYVVPALHQMAGYDDPKKTVIPVQVTEDIRLDPRPEFVRAIFTPPSGAIRTDSNQMSSRLLSNRQANLLLMLPAKSQDKHTIRVGEIVQAVVIGKL